MNTLTGEGLAEALEGASVVLDVSNSPSFDDGPVMEFFTTSTTNQLAAESAAGVGHHVALSVVGTERMSDSGYIRAKRAQEQLIEDGPIPYTIVHATQFFEFAKPIADQFTDGDTVRVPPVLIQPIAADDTADAVCEVCQRPPVDGVIEVAGPEELRFDDLVRRRLAARRRSPHRRRRSEGAVLRRRAATAHAGGGRRRAPRQDPVRGLAGPGRGGVGAFAM